MAIRNKRQQLIEDLTLKLLVSKIFVYLALYYLAFNKTLSLFQCFNNLIIV